MHLTLKQIIEEDLPAIAKQNNRVHFMPGDGRYQPEELKPFLGYDMWASFLIIVEWFWLETLAVIGVMPPNEAALLTHELLLKLLMNITTTMQDEMESKTKHDIMALLELMKSHLPRALHKYLHLGATSYDIICTAYALVLKQAFGRELWPRMQKVDQLWRNRISKFTDVVQAGRTHLQTALPVTVGFWLTVLHHQFNASARSAYELAQRVPGKFTGAVGTSAALITMLGQEKAKQAINTLMESLDMRSAIYTTQITPPQDMARFYFELLLVSGVLGNLGEDTRILQSSQFGEIISASSSSSTMAHKTTNPIVAENLCGMHANITAEFMRVILTLVSDLQRDLRGSSVMRGFSAIMVYFGQQLRSADRLLSSITINPDRIKDNFKKEASLVVAELLQLCLKLQGYAGAHEVVNRNIVPAAAANGTSLGTELQYYIKRWKDEQLQAAWDLTPEHSRVMLKHPEQYLGDAIELAKAEVNNELN